MSLESGLDQTIILLLPPCTIESADGAIKKNSLIYIDDLVANF